MKHLVKETLRGVVTTKCGVTTDTDHATVWWSEADCPACTPYVWVDDPDGIGKMMVARVDITPPKTKVMRRPRRTT